MDKAGFETRPNKIGQDPIVAPDAGHTTVFQIPILLPSDSRAVRILSKSLLFAMFLLSFPSIYTLIKRASSHEPENSNNTFKLLPILLRNLMEEGLIKNGQTGLALGGPHNLDNNDLDFLKDAGIDLLSGAAVDSPQARAFDFVLVPSFGQVGLADRLVRENGLVVSSLGRDPPAGLRLLSNYRIVYLRRLESTVVGLRRSGGPAKGPVCGATSSEEKREALKGLEDVYLEPVPRRAAGRKMRFLPELVKESLAEYPRRVFVSGDDSGAVEWFYGNYPTQGQEFEVYNSMEEMEVKMEDYVVMKAEAGVVEEMLREKRLCLVDELFLECRNQWVDGAGEKRAYWECLSLYGKVRDEGIAVHQWWD
ncbi:conserved peptide upstream open reading frame 47 [Striga asiatica]|uniref:Conserved peptide upstream open reading frame 47 n=1 Tax=Striga asiatica TaxID=4170 RepID=A0A5A7PU97_STRAF|nr:conserved peptide upstream open reading frame 47 [Striga asiatica]